MTSSSVNPAEKFDRSRADEYARQSRIALAGYDACHDLAACMLAASLGEGRAAHIWPWGPVARPRRLSPWLPWNRAGALPL